jgi:hypothetical protein
MSLVTFSTVFSDAVTFSPMTRYDEDETEHPATSRGSFRTIIPKMAVPAAPIPVHTAVASAERNRFDGLGEQSEAHHTSRASVAMRPKPGEACSIL